MIDDSQAMNNPLNVILIIGGSHIDRKGRMQQPYIKGSSIPGHMEETVGGGAYNVGINFARLGADVSFISPRTTEHITGLIARQTKSLECFHDLPLNLTGPAPSYTAILDKHGELIAALADMQLYEDLTPRQILSDENIRLIQQANCLVLDANFPQIVIEDIVKEAKETCLICVMATSPAKALKFENLLHKIDIMGLNLSEANALIGNEKALTNTEVAARELIENGLSGAIITNGSAAASAFTKKSEPISLTPPKASHIADVTGAGDAAFTAFLAGHLMNKSDHDALKLALAASKLTIQSEQTQAAELSIEMLKSIIKNHL